VSLFAFCLPAEHRGVQESRGADRTAETYRCRTPEQNRALCHDNPLLSCPPSARLHLAPVSLSLRATIRKGVNRNGIIYVRARCFDMLSDQYYVENFSDFPSFRVNLDLNSF